MTPWRSSRSCAVASNTAPSASRSKPRWATRPSAPASRRISSSRARCRRLGLGPDGSREVPVGDATALVRVEGEKAALTWRTAAGRDVKTVPKAVKESRGDEVAGLRAEVKEIKKALATQRTRLEGLFAEERAWPHEEWLTLYRDHPLVGGLARQLIWRFDDEAALGEEARESETVRLWRPIDVSPEEVAEWRSRILEAELVQPFKQAFREVYHLAPAERETRTYSNRFAAHIVRYTQAYALMKTPRLDGRGTRSMGLRHGGRPLAARVRRRG